MLIVINEMEFCGAVSNVRDEKIKSEHKHENKNYNYSICALCQRVILLFCTLAMTNN